MRDQLISLINSRKETTTYSYDNNGNLLSETVGAANPTSYIYDYEDRLTDITYPDSSTSAYTYDGGGKRIQTVEGGNTTKFLYDGLSAVIERDASNTTIATYTRGLSSGGGIGGIISRTAASTTHYYHYDGIGSVTELTDSNSNIDASYTYDAYGNQLSSSGGVTNPYRFSTKEYFATSGLVYFGARYYNPSIGRWTQADPLGMVDGPNLYLYCANNPVNLIDPWGLTLMPISAYSSGWWWGSGSSNTSGGSSGKGGCSAGGTSNDPGGGFWGILLGLLSSMVDAISTSASNLGKAASALGQGLSIADGISKVKAAENKIENTIQPSIDRDQRFTNTIDAFGISSVRWRGTDRTPGYSGPDTRVGPKKR